MKRTTTNRNASLPITIACILALGGALPAAAQEPTGPDGVRIGPAFQDDLKEVTVPLIEQYASRHPRLLFSAEDIPDLKRKAEEQPALWNLVVANAESLVRREVPDEREVAGGAHYWRIEFVQSGALAYVLTGEQKYLDAARNWMVRYCRGEIWGEGWGENVDLFAGWYLYHIGIAYDLLREHLDEEDRVLIRDGLADHARAVSEDGLETRYTDGFRYDQNHTYIPVTGMVAASLAIMDEVPEAHDWLRRGYVIMNRSRYVLGHDGYYYEGPAYWAFALHWHARYAELMGRATGDMQQFMALPALARSWLYALHTSLPGFPWGFDMHDTGRWPDGKRGGGPRVTQHPYLWAVAGALRDGNSQLAGDFLNRRGPEWDYPASAFLWYDPSLEPADLEAVKPRHYFEDHGVVFWRTGWEDEEATCIAFRCGPPQGHAATEKLKAIDDWIMNSGHVHPDIGAFYLYGRGTYLAGGTGFTARKFTRDHNTLLVSGKGQGVDGSYWNDRGWPYERFDAARIEAVHLSEKYAYARGEFSSVYPNGLELESLHRTLLASEDYVLIVDRLKADRPRSLTWFVHTDEPFRPLEEGRYLMEKADGRLLVQVLEHRGVDGEVLDIDAAMEPTVVMAGTAPGDGTPTQRGHHLALETGEAAEVTLVTLLVPLGPHDPPLEYRVEPDHEPPGLIAIKLFRTPDEAERLRVDTGWTAEDGGEPATIRPAP